ncbi:hypothetical protein PIB30_040952 [Stylosanthes scabra]|uniref:Agenet-like domain-containing protein n=1 Tax=Stylosanthes scabra TaxID=79078 RepID=A0ABU6RFD3_9FABA|nr:hypothetical protein [Stylosanthes scabra]
MVLWMRREVARRGRRKKLNRRELEEERGRDDIAAALSKFETHGSRIQIQKPETLLRPSAASSSPSSIFKPGTRVEVRSGDDDGFRGSWFSGTVIPRTGADKFMVKFECLTASWPVSEQEEAQRAARTRKVNS